MALRNPSMFNFGYTIDSSNKYLPFRVTSDVEYLATLDEGYYSSQTLADEIITQMQAFAPTINFQISINRTVNSNTENRWTIAAPNATYFSLNFATGTNASDSVWSEIGFNASDYTGALTYTGASDTGTKLITAYSAYNYLPPETFKTQSGVTTTSVRGDKDTIIWSTQRFIQCEFKYEPEVKVKTDWQDLMDWMSKIRPFDFTPDYVSAPCDVYSVTLEKDSVAGNGLGYKWQEMLPQFPFNYTTGQMAFRVTPSTGE
jgi:hypothetical protein